MRLPTKHSSPAAERGQEKSARRSARPRDLLPADISKDISFRMHSFRTALVSFREQGIPPSLLSSIELQIIPAINDEAGACTILPRRSELLDGYSAATLVRCSYLQGNPAIELPDAIRFEDTRFFSRLRYGSTCP
jgi:hypothetical protein